MSRIDAGRVIGEFAEAGFDELYIQQIGAEHERFFELYASEVLPRFAHEGAAEALAASRR